MKKNILHYILCGAIALGVASCDENSWNDRYLDGFEGGVDYTDAQTVTYTLTDDDYETIASLLQSAATTDEQKAAAKAIGSNYYFDKTSVYPASVAIPYFLESTSSPYYYLSSGSSMEVGYTEVSEQPAEIAAIAAATQYTVTTADYQKVWGSETAFISSFAPDQTAAANIPALLKSSIEDAENGQYAIVTFNTANENPMFGYPEGGIPSANLYEAEELEAGKYFIVAIDNVPNEGTVVASNIPESGTYGYLNSGAVTYADGVVTGVDPETQQFEFEAAEEDGEFYIKDELGRYYYQTGTYNSFNVSAELGSGSGTTVDNYTWIVTSQDNNTWEIMNKGMNKWIQTPFGSYSTWGSYSYKGDDSDNFPWLFVLDEDSAAEPVEIPLVTPASVTQNVVYYFNGSSWSVAEGTAVLNPADYTSMGFTNNNLSDAEIYLPMYMRAQYPYAMEGDQYFVAYNLKSSSSSCTVDLLVYNGTTWAVNNDNMENVTGLFAKSGNSWSFVKYLGKAVYNLFQEDQIQLDRTYLIASGNAAATPVPTSSSYGYLLTTKISVSNGQVIMPNDANGFTFQSQVEVNGSTVNAPEGQFVIRDSNGRYLYLQGTYNSFNVRADAPAIENGAISSLYLFKATKNADGSWNIQNTNEKIMYYSSQYSNFAGYASQGANDSLPYLYLLD